MIIWGGLRTDSKMLVEVKANTCVLKDSLIREKNLRTRIMKNPPFIFPRLLCL